MSGCSAWLLGMLLQVVNGAVYVPTAGFGGQPSKPVMYCFRLDIRNSVPAMIRCESAPVLKLLMTWPLKP
ncbi:hypothetical protein D3C87_1862330 [compost metagenome]